METRHYWEENGHVIKYDNYNSNDGFGRPGDAVSFVAAPPSEDEAEFPPNYLKKGKQDPMSHRIIEKRRRDRMNNCLADLSRLIPPEYLKKGRGRVEKTEIIEMAIRHLKTLQDRANAAERQAWGEQFRAGYQEASAETLRYLADQGYPSADPLTMSLTAHLKRHCDHVAKGGIPAAPKEVQTHSSHPGSSSETASSSGSSHGYSMKSVNSVIAQAPPLYSLENYEPERHRQEQEYAMDCDRVAVAPLPLPSDGEVPQPENEPLPLDIRRKKEPTLRAIRKPDHEDFLHSYKFKNSIERRFSKSQDSEAAELVARAAHKSFGHKRRRAVKFAPSTCTSASGSTEDNRDTSPQDTSSESPHRHYEAPAVAQYVPVFALNALGKYYVPLNVEYGCLARHPGPFDALGARAARVAAPLHPVTINVNFQPCLYHVKREPNERDWRPV